MSKKKNVEIEDLLDKQRRAIYDEVVVEIKQFKADCLENVISASEYDDKLKAIIDTFDDMAEVFNTEDDEKEWALEYK